MRPPTLPGHIRLLEVVGRGAGSTVWRARDRRRGRDVAVKVVDVGGPDGPIRRVRFESEVRALTRLSRHPGVPVVMAVGADTDSVWMVVPLADEALIDLVRRSGPLEPATVLGIADAVVGALAAAHTAEIVHGDVSPANVLLIDGAAVLADFGLAVVEQAVVEQAVVEQAVVEQAVVPRAGSDEGTGFARPAATPEWAAPEVLDGEAPSPASDVYGLGATIWTAATAEHPRPGVPPDVAVLARGLSSIVATCCDPTPSKRPTADQVARAAAAEAARRSRYCPGP